MGKLVLKDCYIVVNSVNFSDHVSSVEVNLSKDEVETTNFSGQGRERVAGLKDDNFVINFQQDFAAAQVDSVLYPLWNNETEFIVEVRPTSSAVSATNPKYTATCVLLEYQPLSGSVGDLSETEVTFPTQRTGITRATS
jgi:UTP:GlnB (protein PII) uridylyltransferase